MVRFILVSHYIEITITVVTFSCHATDKSLLNLYFISNYIYTFSYLSIPIYRLRGVYKTPLHT